MSTRPRSARHLIVLGLVALATIGARWDYSRADAAAALAGASALARCVVAHESGGDPNAIGALGEEGLAQLYRRGNEWPRFMARYSDPFDPWQAVAFLEEELQAGYGYRWSAWWGCR